MDRRFKKIFSVLFALLIGIGVVFFAWKSGTVTYTGNAPSDNSWKDTLNVVPQVDSLKTLIASQESFVGNDATTTVDIVARNLLTSYALAQRNNMSTTTLRDNDIEAIAEEAVSKIALPQATQFTIKNLNISSDNSPSAIDAYMKELGTAVKTFASSQTQSDTDVAFAIPKTGDDTKRLLGIARNISNYEKLIRGLLTIKTPSVVTQPHLHLVQKYANIQARIKPMADIFTDPLRGLAALAEYRGEIAGFNIIAEEYTDYISRHQQ